MVEASSEGRRSPRATVKIEALCRKADDPTPVLCTFEEQVPIGPILHARSIQDAVDAVRARARM